MHDVTNLNSAVWWLNAYDGGVDGTESAYLEYRFVLKEEQKIPKATFTMKRPYTSIELYGAGNTPRSIKWDRSITSTLDMQVALWWNCDDGRWRG
jgi:hypothetical protein